MAVTFAGNGIYLGALAGLATAVVTRNLAAGVVVAVAASVAGWYAIRAMEKLLGRGVNAGFTAASNWMNRPGTAPAISAPAASAAKPLPPISDSAVPASGASRP